MLISSNPSSAYMSVQTPKLSLLPLLPSGNHKFDLQVCEYTSALQTSPCIRILVFCILILIILKCSIQCIKHVHNVVPPLPLSNSQTCQQPKCKPSTHSALPHPWPPLVCFLPLWIHLLWMFHISGIMCRLLCLAQHHVLKGHSCSSCQCSIPSYGGMMFHCMDMPHLVHMLII